MARGDARRRDPREATVKTGTGSSKFCSRSSTRRRTLRLHLYSFLGRSNDGGCYTRGRLRVLKRSHLRKGIGWPVKPTGRRGPGGIVRGK
jgi:hypothetical protein